MVAKPDDDPILGPAALILETVVRAKRQARRSADVGFDRKAARAAALRRIDAITRRRPEVMVKVTGSARGQRRIREHLAYISRNGRIPVLRENGEVIDGRESVREVAEEWWACRGNVNRRDRRDTINIVLSMPEGTDRRAVARAAEAFASATFGGEHDYMLAHHTDTASPHAHLTVRTRGHRGQNLHPVKADLQRWRESFVVALAREGVHAEATPRRTRGVIKKGERQAVRHLKKRTQSNVVRWRIEQAIKTVRSGNRLRDEPWKPAIRARQQQIRRAWLTLAQGVEAEGKIALGMQIRTFTQQMPSLETLDDRFLKEAISVIDKARDQGRSR